MNILAAPSILSADFSAMGDAIHLVESAGGDWIHVDVMDGHFVPDITFGHKMVRDIRSKTSLPLDTHLMITNPEPYFERFAEAGSDHITFHLEASTHAHRAISLIRELGKKPGISIVPSTPASALEEVLDQVFLVLVMTVNPGYGGQKLIPGCVEKVRKLDRLRTEHGLSFRIVVDGGINTRTAPIVREAGADVLVAGSAFFDAEDPAQVVRILRGDSGT